MNDFSVSDVAKILDVGEETVRRWIRDNKLNAKRALGRGGSTIRLEDIVDFVNEGPSIYQLNLMIWLIENDIKFTKATSTKFTKTAPKLIPNMLDILGLDDSLGTNEKLESKTIIVLKEPEFEGITQQSEDTNMTEALIDTAGGSDRVTDTVPTRIETSETSKDKVAIFVDGYLTKCMQQELGWRIGLTELLRFCKQFGNVVEANYYEYQYSLDQWTDSGFSPITDKKNIDIEIAMDACSLIEQYDIAVFVGGDESLIQVIQRLKSRGKRVKLLSTQHCATNELIRIMGINYIDLPEIRKEIGTFYG